jgi:hypothetical protein
MLKVEKIFSTLKMEAGRFSEMLIHYIKLHSITAQKTLFFSPCSPDINRNLGRTQRK